jgi:hypothetical protein
MGVDMTVYKGEEKNWRFRLVWGETPARHH